MTISREAVQAVQARLDRLKTHPPMFHDVLTPSVIRRRRARILAWRMSRRFS